MHTKETKFALNEMTHTVNNEEAKQTANLTEILITDADRCLKTSALQSGAL